MSETASNWALYYKLDDAVPREFCEVRRVGSSVWVRTGKVNTWGSGDLNEYDGVQQATDAFQAACEQKAEDGWVLTRDGVYDPARFDFDQLRAEIREGARQAFTAIKVAHPEATINGFALVSDESAMTIGPMANSEESLREAGGEDDFRFNPNEWPYDEGGEFLDIAYRLILPRHQDVPQEIPFAEFRNGVFETVVSALEQLDQEGLFGQGPEREQLFLLVHVTDSDPLEDAIRRLNTPDTYARYQEWWETWN